MQWHGPAMGIGVIKAEKSVALPGAMFVTNYWGSHGLSVVVIATTP